MKEIVLGIICKDNKILMVKRKKEEGNLIWVFPGGKVEPRETKEQACIREVYEETSLNISIINILGERIHPDTETQITYYLCQYKSGQITILDKNEILEIAYKIKDEFFHDVKTDIYEPVKTYIKLN